MSGILLWDQRDGLAMYLDYGIEFQGFLRMDISYGLCCCYYFVVGLYTGGNNYNLLMEPVGSISGLFLEMSVEEIPVMPDYYLTVQKFVHGIFTLG